MHRLLVPSECLSLGQAVLPPGAAHHLKVLRPRPGEAMELFDGRGRTRRYVYAAGALAASGPCVDHPRPPRELALFACVTKGSRWDWTIEKAVELGVTRIVPVISERCIVRLSASERPSKAARWRRIAEDAARQSDAVWLPEVVEAEDFPAALDIAAHCGRIFAGALMSPPPPPLWTALGACGDSGGLGLFVGPEGDFTPDELRALLAVAEPVSLGPTILRAETAAIYGMSVLAAFSESMARGMKQGSAST